MYNKHETFYLTVWRPSENSTINFHFMWKFHEFEDIFTSNFFNRRHTCWINHMYSLMLFNIYSTTFYRSKYDTLSADLFIEIKSKEVRSKFRQWGSRSIIRLILGCEKHDFPTASIRNLLIPVEWTLNKSAIVINHCYFHIFYRLWFPPKRECWWFTHLIPLSFLESVPPRFLSPPTLPKSSYQYSNSRSMIRHHDDNEYHSLLYPEGMSSWRIHTYIPNHFGDTSSSLYLLLAWDPSSTSPHWACEQRFLQGPPRLETCQRLRSQSREAYR